MATVAELEKKLDDHISSNDLRFDKLDSKITTYQFETVREMVKNTTILEMLRSTMEDVSAKLEVIKEKPVKRYESIVLIVASALIGGGLTMIFNSIAK